MPRDDNFLGVAGAATCAAGFVAMIILYAASLAGAAEVAKTDPLQVPKFGLSKVEVFALANEWRVSQQRRRSSAAPKVVVASDAAPKDTSYIIRAVADVAGWGTVVIGETEDGDGRVYAAAAAQTDTTHLTIHHFASAQKFYALNSVAVAASGVRDTRLLPDEEGPDEPRLRRGLIRRAVCDPGQFTDRETGRTVIRVGVLHTPEVLATDYYRGSSESVQAEVAVAVAVGNADAFPQSGVGLKIELCVNGPLPPNTPSLERTSPRATLDAFATSSAVEAVRAANKCDTMVLFATLGSLGNRACGIGYLPGEHAVVAADCFVDNFSFLHELGHNIGACHGPPSRPCGAGANGYGDATNDFRTILAYRAICGGGEGNCTRVPRFSNKKSGFNWKGEAIGDDRSDNAWILNANKGEVASRMC